MTARGETSSGGSSSGELLGPGSEEEEEGKEKMGSKAQEVSE